MSNITLRNGEAHLTALLRATPVTAARNGVLGVLYDAMVSQKMALAPELLKASAPLCAELECADLYGAAEALSALDGRPPKRVTSALRSPEMVTVMRAALDMLELWDLSDRVAAWGPQSATGPGSVLPMSANACAQRTALVDALRARALELQTEWTRLGLGLSPGPLMVDGRSLLAAARAWQLPLITGELPPPPIATAAMHPNRLGRTAAVVIYSRLGQALRAKVPDEELVEPLALLVAVGEAISSPRRRGVHRTAEAMHGLVKVAVRNGLPIDDESLGVDTWWPVFDSWGSSSRAVAMAIPTAWRLTDAEGDVLVWALCSVAARIAAVSSVPAEVRNVRVLAPVVADPWPAHREVELPNWEAGARSVWSLMQQPRRFEARTTWPGCISPSLGTDYSWPWRPTDA
jgi:hypothetical protein